MAFKEWEAVEAAKDGIQPSEMDKKDGFIHLSTHDSLLGTVNLYFPPETEPVALEIDSALLGQDLKWEAVEARGGAFFPHHYGPNIPLSTVIAVQKLKCVSSDDGKNTYELDARQCLVAKGDKNRQYADTGRFICQTCTIL